MRKLTQQEIDQAPDWATHYIVDSDNDLMYESVEWWCWSISPKQLHDNYHDIGGQPIPLKEFDIGEYSFYGLSFNRVDSDGDIVFNGSFYGDDGYLNKQDTIASAKHFKLTAGDLI